MGIREISGLHFRRSARRAKDVLNSGKMRGERVNRFTMGPGKVYLVGKSRRKKLENLRSTKVKKKERKMN